MNWVWVERCVNKKYHNDKYVQLRVPVLKNSCSIDDAHAHPCLKFEKLFEVSVQHYYICPCRGAQYDKTSVHV